MLEHEALRYYYDMMPAITTSPTMVGGHYYLLCSIDDDILFHVQSVVTFCHICDPQRFNQLNQTLFRSSFPNYRVIPVNGSCVSFRVMSIDKFKEIVK